MTGFRQAIADAFAHGAFPPGTNEQKVVNAKESVRSWAEGFGGEFLPGKPISMRLLIRGIESIPPYHASTPTPTPSSPHIQLSFGSADVIVTGSGFLANLPGVDANAVHLHVVDVDNVTNSTILQYPSDSSGNFSAELQLSDPVFGGIVTVAFSAYDNRLDPTSVPANGPLTSNTVRVTNILSPDRQVST
jgi:hypothetical protein